MIYPIHEKYTRAMIWALALLAMIAINTGRGFAASPGTLNWRFTTGDDVRNSPLIGQGGIIYVGSGDSYIYAVNPDGSEAWKFPTGGVVYSSPVQGDDGSVYFGSGDKYLYALTADGKPRWRYETGDVIYGSPTIGPNGTIFFGGFDNHVYALNPDGTLKWKFETQSIVFTKPAVTSTGTVYCGSGDTYLYALNPDGTEKWKYQTGGGIFSDPAVGRDGTIYCGSLDNYVYALNADGTLKWRYKTGDGVYSNPFVGMDGTIYVGSWDSYIYALDAEGNLRWRYKTGKQVFSSPVVSVDGTVFCGSDDGYLYALNPDGTEKWKYLTGGVIDGQPAIGPDGTVLFGSWDDHLYALNENNTYFLPVFKPSPGFWSGLGVTNRNDTQVATVTANIYSTSGALLSTQSKAIQAGGQDAFVIGGGVSESGWIQVVSDEPLGGLNFLGRYVGSTSNYYLADVPFTGSLSVSLLIPHVAQNENWDTVLFLANPGSIAASVSLVYTDKSGEASPAYLVDIPAMGSTEVSVQTIGGSNAIRGGYVSISSNTGLTAFALYDNLKSVNYSYAGINAVDQALSYTTYEYALPVFKARPGYWSGFGVTNMNSTSLANVTATVYSQAGTAMETVPKTIPAGGQTVFVIGAELTGDGWIKITSDRPLGGLNFIGQYIDDSTDFYLADVPFTHMTSTLLLIPHVAQNGNWDTMIFMANPNVSGAGVTLTYTDKTGTVTYSHQTTIPANGSKEVSVDEITGGINNKGGYVVISSTRKLTAFALYNNLKTGNFSYAGINAVDISQ